MNIEGTTSTRVGRVVYDRPKHYYTYKDARRIVGNLLIHDRITMTEAVALAKILWPVEYRLSVSEQSTLARDLWNFFYERAIPFDDVVLSFTRRLVDLELKVVKDYLLDWAKKVRR